MNDDFIIVKVPTEKCKRKRKIIIFSAISIVIILFVIIINLLYFDYIKDINSVRKYTFSDTKIEIELISGTKDLAVQTRIMRNGSFHMSNRSIDFDFALENKLVKRGGLMQRFANFILKTDFYNVDERAVYAYLLNEELSKNFNNEIDNKVLPEADSTIRFEGEEEQENQSAENDIENISSEIFVTISGECYHLSNCRFLGKSKIPIELSEAKEKYRACTVCSPLE